MIENIAITLVMLGALLYLAYWIMLYMEYFKHNKNNYATSVAISKMLISHLASPASFSIALDLRFSNHLFVPS